MAVQRKYRMIIMIMIKRKGDTAATLLYTYASTRLSRLAAEIVY